MTDARSKSPQPQWLPSSPPVTADQFDDLICSPLVIVHFWAPWNPYDKQLDANLQQARKKFPKIPFYSANADDTTFTPIMERFHVAALPALVCFANSRTRGRFHGVETLQALESFLTNMSQPQPR